MKNIINSSIILVAFVLLFSGCNEDKVFELNRPPQNAWKESINNVDLGIMNVYNMTYGDNGYEDMIGGCRSYDYYTSDLSNVVPGGGSNRYGTYINWYDRNVNSLDFMINYWWSKSYRAINGANDMLDFINNAENSGKQAYVCSKSTYEETIPRAKGELYYLRASAYFKLVEFYCMSPDPSNSDASAPRIPKKFGFITDPLVLKNTPLMNSKEALDSIVSDFKKAKALLPGGANWNKWSPISAEGRVNHYAASAMLARAYFYMGNYQMALDECKYILSSGEFNLNNEPIEAFNKKYKEAPSKEVILEYVAMAGGSVYKFQSYYLDDIGKVHDAGVWFGGRATKEHPKEANFGIYNFGTFSKFACSYTGWMDEKGNPTADSIDKRYKQIYWRADTFYCATPSTGIPYDVNRALYLLNQAKLNARPGEASLLDNIVKIPTGDKKTPKEYDILYKDKWARYANIEKMNWVMRPAWLADTIDYLNGFYAANGRFINTNNKRFSRPSIFVDKYHRYISKDETKTDPTESSDAAKFPLIRYAEIILTHAILSFKNGDVEAAKNDINAIRKRAGLADLLIVTEEDIHKERVKELTGEDDRLRYLRSLKMPVGLGDRTSGDPVLFPYKGLMWRIPVEETNNNAAYPN